MLDDGTKRKLTITDIGYYGKPLDGLNRNELMGACLQLAQALYECSNKDVQCKKVFTFRK